MRHCAEGDSYRNLKETSDLRCLGALHWRLEWSEMHKFREQEYLTFEAYSGLDSSRTETSTVASRHRLDPSLLEMSARCSPLQSSFEARNKLFDPKHFVGTLNHDCVAAAEVLDKGFNIEGVAALIMG